MDSCLVCLESSDDHTPPCIKGNSIEWQKYNVQRIIEKHLWWWHSKATKNNIQIDESVWICQQCWEHLWTFHRFYLRVEKVHKRYYAKWNVWCSYTEPDLEKDPIIPMCRKGDEDENMALREDPIPLSKISRDYAENENVKHENMTIDEFATTAHVKSEADNDHDSFDSDDQEHNGNDDLDEIEKDKYKSKNVSRQWPTVRGDTLKMKRKSVLNNLSTNNKSAKKQGLSSTEIVKKYDEFIATNYEIFCSLCHEPLSSFQTLNLHFQREHEGTKPFVTCCGLKFHKRAMLVDHLHTHKDPESFKCQLCSKALPNRRSLKSHLEWHDKTNKPQFQCNECSKIFFTRASCEKHKLSHVPENEKHVPCTECDKKFASELLRLQHFNASHLKKYAKICDTCGKQFSNRDYFQRHLAEHSGIPTASIQCDICGLKITSIYGLNRHKKLRHTEESMQAVACPHCSKLIPNSAALRHHIEYAHKQRKHTCNLCDKAFRRPKELKEHLSTHTGETPYTCAHCSKAFRRHNKLYIHVKNQHPKEWEEARLNKVGGVLSQVSAVLGKEKQKQNRSE